MTPSVSLRCCLVVLAAPAAAPAANTYHFDFGPEPQAKVQAGFTAISMPAGLIGKAFIIPSGQLSLTVASGNPGVDSSLMRLTGVDRGAPPNSTFFGYSDLLRDFVAATNTANSQPWIGLVVDGFTNNTRYEARFWSYDAAAPAQNDEKSEWFLDGKSFATHVYNTSLPPRTNTDVRTGFTTTFDIGADPRKRKVEIVGKYVAGPQVSVVLNGVEFVPVAAIPEVASWQLLAAGLPLLAWWARRRVAGATA